MHYTTDLRPLLRREVGRFRQRESRRVFGVTVHVGALDSDRASFDLTPDILPVLDTALRVDLVAALLDGVDRRCDTAWLTRPGAPYVHDTDLAWLSAADRAFTMCGCRLNGFFAVTRVGWLDVRTGERREWKRLRL